MAGFALRALGMVFRVFVAARLGPEGMGLYQLILSVYMVFVSLAASGPCRAHGSGTAHPAVWTPH